MQTLDELRSEITTIDQELLTLLARRNKCSELIGVFKFENRTSIVQNDYFAKKLSKLQEDGKNMGLAKTFVRRIWRTIHHESIQSQERIWKKIKSQSNSNNK